MIAELDLLWLKEVNPTLATKVQKLKDEVDELNSELKREKERTANLEFELNKIKSEFEVLRSRLLTTEEYLEEKKQASKEMDERIKDLDSASRKWMFKAGIADAMKSALLEEIVELKTKVIQLASRDIRDELEDILEEFEMRILKGIEDKLRTRAPVVIEKAGEKA